MVGAEEIMPRAKLRVKKKVWGGLAWVEGELEIEADSVKALLEISEKLHMEIK